jgi:hypothetical protein
MGARSRRSQPPSTSWNAVMFALICDSRMLLMPALLMMSESVCRHLTGLRAGGRTLSQARLVPYCINNDIASQATG